MLSRNFYWKHREWQYKDIKPAIIVEKLLLDEDKKIPVDYKFHCFNGKVKIVQVDLDRHSVHKRNIYDENWNQLNMAWEHPRGNPLSKPNQFNKMKSLAEKLANGFLVVRVDFYYVKGKIFFGEMTFNPASGYEKFIPKMWDRKLGEFLQIRN